MGDIIFETGATTTEAGASIDEEFFIFGFIYLGILRDDQRPMSTADLVAAMFDYTTGTRMVGPNLARVVGK